MIFFISVFRPRSAARIQSLVFTESEKAELLIKYSRGEFVMWQDKKGWNEQSITAVLDFDSVR